MSQLSIQKFGDNLPVTSIVAFSQAVTGFGVGLLVADGIRRDARRSLGLAGVILGSLALTPLVLGIVSQVQNRPGSSRRMRKQLEGIRRDVGIDDNPPIV